MSLKIKMWIARMFQYVLYFFVPLKRNRIMFYAHNRKGYVGNPRYLMEYLNETYPGAYELVWVSAWPQDCESMQGVTVVARRSFLFFFKYIRTKLFITNDMIDENLIKKRGQIYLSTWHGGGAYKKVGLSTRGENAEFARAFKRNYQRLDYFVSSCKKCSEYYPAAFGLPPERFLATGTPRNDLFFRSHSDYRNKVQDFFHLAPGTKILLYAPSFRMHEKEIPLDGLRRMMEQLNKKETWVCLYRAHYFDTPPFHTEDGCIRDGNSYFEMQELLCAADLLVTDFSSCMWDFCLTGRPVIRLETDMEEYESIERGFFVPRSQWPFPTVQNLAELPGIYAGTDWDAYREKAAAHLDWMGSYEQGNACQTIIQFLINILEETEHGQHKE